MTIDVRGLDLETMPNTEQIVLIQVYNPNTDITKCFHNYKDELWKVYEVDHAKEESGDYENAVTFTDRVISSDSLKRSLPKMQYATFNGYYEDNKLKERFDFNPNIVADGYILSFITGDCPKFHHSLDACMKHYVDPNYDKYKYGDWEHQHWHLETLMPEAILYGARDAKAAYVLEKAIREKNGIAAIERKVA